MNEIIIKEEKIIVGQYPELLPLLHRLDGITGFVSILGDDPRIKVFRRLNHVRRVVWFTNWLCQKFSKCDRKEAMLIAWCHDINRLPFAHNLEKKIKFDQSKNIEDYLQNHNITLPQNVVAGIKQMLNKDCTGTFPARLAYAADAVAGFIEDPLFAITTLEIPLESIPVNVASHLGFDVNDEQFRKHLDNLKTLFQVSPQEFEEQFNKTVFDYGMQFLKKHNTGGNLFVEQSTFKELRQELKEDFLRAKVFPINNEEVSHGPELARDVGMPLIKCFQDADKDPIITLQSFTDQEALEAAEAKGLVGSMDTYFPNIPSSGHSKIQSSLTNLAKKLLNNNDGLQARKLEGGLSGASVYLINASELINTDTTPLALVVKIGSAATIERELDGRQKYSEGNESLENKLLWLSSKGLNIASEEFSASNNDLKLKAMVCHYFGAKSFTDLEQYADFQGVFRDFCGVRKNITESQLEILLRSLFSKLPTIEDLNQIAGVSLRDFLPDIRWDRSVAPILNTASAFIGEGGDELAKLKSWWLDESSKIHIAPWTARSLLHGDLRFANVLVNFNNHTNIEIIDFGNVTQGHVLQDLAKFECDLLFRIQPKEMKLEGKPWSKEELCIRTLQYAFTSGFLCTTVKEKGPDNYSHLKALQILRSTYNEKFHIESQPGRFDMYRWFLLAEVLKRLTWFGTEFTHRDARRALVYSVLLLKRSIDGQKNIAPCFIAADHLVRELGVRAAYVATREYRETINERRNAAKISALEKAANNRGSTVKLIAETGHSYLCSKRPFHPYIRDFLEKKGKLKIVLINPSFIERHAISAAYGEPDRLNKLEIHEDVLSKMIESFHGYQELKRQGHDIKIHISTYGLPATTLLTDDVVFFEPYFRVHRVRRENFLFDSFELEMTDKIILKLMDDNFNFYWKNSPSLEQFQGKQESWYKDLFKTWFDKRSQ